MITKEWDMEGGWRLEFEEVILYHKIFKDNV